MRSLTQPVLSAVGWASLLFLFGAAGAILTLAVPLLALVLDGLLWLFLRGLWCLWVLARFLLREAVR